MPLKLFIVGLPGAGKSAITRYIRDIVENKFGLGTGRNWVTTRFNDYPILHSMFTDDKEGKRFEPAGPDGFNVLDFCAFDDALKFMGKWISWHITSKQMKQQELLLIEFARNDYSIAFNQLKPELLRDAYFIYLGSDVKVCQERIHERVANPENEDDDYLVSNRIFETYYHSDDGFHIVDILTQEFGIAGQQILALDNTGSLDDVKQAVETFVEHMLEPTVCNDLPEKLADRLVLPLRV